MNNIIQVVTVLLATTKIYLKTHTVYTRHFALSMLSYPVQLAAMYYVWKHVLEEKALSVLLPYYAVVLMLAQLQVFRAMVRVMGDLITTGDIVLVLTRPFYLWQPLLGRSLARGTGTMILGVPILFAIFYVAGVKITVVAFLEFIVVALASFVMEFLLFYNIGLTSFWTERTWGQTILAGFLVEILGGRLVPIFVFPEWVQEILQVLPFVHIAFTPARVLLFPETISSLFTLLMQQLLWLTILVVTAALLWKRGVKRYQGYGI